MNKPELIDWLQREQENWLALIAQVNPTALETPGLNEAWSVKDLIAHLTVWHQDHVLCLAAAAKGQPPADPPWPLAKESTDEINAWIHTHHQDRAFADVLAESKKTFQDLMAIVQAFPEDTEIENESQTVKLGAQSFAVGYFFNHFHQDHEGQLQRWIEKNKSH